MVVSKCKLSIEKNKVIMLDNHRIRTYTNKTSENRKKKKKKHII